MDETDVLHRAFYDAEVSSRAERPLGPDRERAVNLFADLLSLSDLGTLLEVGSGAGRDAAVLATSGAHYVGLDLSPGPVHWIADAGRAGVVGSALALPFADGCVDAVWSMSTLMHLRGDGLDVALAEIGRVVRPGGLVGIGVWGADVARERCDEHGRYFRHRTDDELRGILAVLGRTTHFEAWSPLEDGAHYQWAVVEVHGG